ncbi:MAG TPA: hypothetical protein DDX29_00595 [Clostridiales bacterium]|nr:hypothetical protein [Clostridiales bacterium]
MSKKISKKAVTIIAIFISLGVSLVLAAQILLNITLFFERQSHQQVKIFSIITLALFVLVIFVNQAFIMPYLSKLKDKKSLFFLGIMVAILTISLSIGAKHYWSIPNIHSLEICFTAEDESGRLKIDEMIDPNTNRQYSPNSLGFSRYPMYIESGECLNGNLVNLDHLRPRWYIVPRLRILIKTSPPDGRFYIAVNDVPSVVLFDQDDEEPFNGEIMVDEGFDQGNRSKIPWGKAWFLAVKAGGLFLSAIYLSLFFFGLTERMISYTNIENVIGSDNK